MPRLLLVDDNPSIHKIAETLLANGPIELVCVDSAAAALAKVNRGELFDVALLDTSMAGMDGWGLLAKLRDLPATARMPIAMMAGVLDTVDPERIKAAPIQGFLKKPVELRDLGERVMRLMETPVPLPEPVAPAPRVASPFATMPATRLDELPEFRQRPKETPPVEEDVLELTEEDLYPEIKAAEPREETLDLEELDLEGLQVLVPQPAAAPVAAFEEVPAVSEPTPQGWAWQGAPLDAVATLDRLPELPAEAPGLPASVPEVELPDLGAPAEALMDISSLGNLPEIEESAAFDSGSVTAPEMDLAGLLEPPEDVTPFAPALAAAEEPLDWADESESMLAAVEAPAPSELVPLPEEDLDVLDVSAPEETAVPEEVAAPATFFAEFGEALQVPAAEFVPAAELVPVPELEIPVLPPAAIEAVPAEAVAAPVPAPALVLEPAPALGAGSQELLEALMADPALMDTLAKAVVARLGDQVLREIAWEVMPELAERLPRS